MMTVEDLINELAEFPKQATVRVAVEVVDGHDVRIEKAHVEAVKFEDDEAIVELG